MSFQERRLADFASLQAYRKSVGYSVSAYDTALLPFLRYCGECYPDVESITKEMVNSWLSHHSYNTPSSQGVFISCLRQYTRFIRANGKEVFIPDDDYTVQRQRFIPYIFTADELTAFFRTVDMVCPVLKKWRQDIILPVLFRMIYCCGMRPGEPLRLTCDDVDLKTGDIYIRQSKGCKDRHILMSDDLRYMCLKYDLLAGPREWFFPKWDGGPLPTYWLDNQFRKCWARSGIPSRGTPRLYDLRHAFATRNLMRWTEEGLDVMVMLPYLSAYMGHSHFYDTLYYVHLLPERLRGSDKVDWHLLDSIYGGGA